MFMVNKIKEMILNSHEKGIPLPMLRDPKTNQPSVTLTMFVVSFTVSVTTLVGKITELLGSVEYSNTLWLLSITGGMYLGRKFQNNDKGVTVEKD